MISNDRSNWIIPVTVKNLVSLRIGFYRLIYEDLCALIGPYLCRLYLEVYDDPIPIDFSHLGALLISTSQKLKQFNCDYRGKTVNIYAIRTAHFLFRDIDLVNSLPNDTIKLICRNMAQLRNEVFKS